MVRGARLEVPRLEAVARHREANTYSLLIVALLERGESMTLDEVAERFEAAGIADRGRALLSLQRCEPEATDAELGLVQVGSQQSGEAAASPTARSRARSLQTTAAVLRRRHLAR